MKTRMLFLAVTMMAGACGKPAPVKGSGARSTTAAKDAGQKAASQVTSNTSKAQASGSMKDGVTCDASLEGVAFCATDTTAAFCAQGQWWALDCTALEASSFCGVDTSTLALDCWLPEG